MSLLGSPLTGMSRRIFLIRRLKAVKCWNLTGRQRGNRQKNKDKEKLKKIVLLKYEDKIEKDSVETLKYIVKETKSDKNNMKKKKRRKKKKKKNIKNYLTKQKRKTFLIGQMENGGKITSLVEDILILKTKQDLL